MRLVAGLLAILVTAQGVPEVAKPTSPTTADATDSVSGTFQDAQRSFYNGDYDVVAIATTALLATRPDDIALHELQSSTRLFQIKRALGDLAGRDKGAAWKQCAACPDLMAAFLAVTTKGRTLARARLDAHPSDQESLFLLGKLDLNYVWLRLGTLGHKTGWDEYWEGRRSLDGVLRADPAHGRARVARAWIDYIVGTQVPRGTRWLLGGGNRKRGLATVRSVVSQADGDFFVLTEARFALWDMHVREREVAEAVATARVLMQDFPNNRELRKFLAAHDPGTSGP